MPPNPGEGRPLSATPSGDYLAFYVPGTFGATAAAPGVSGADLRTGQWFQVWEPETLVYPDGGKLAFHFPDDGQRLAFTVGEDERILQREPSGSWDRGKGLNAFPDLAPTGAAVTTDVRRVTSPADESGRRSLAYSTVEAGSRGGTDGAGDTEGVPTRVGNRFDPHRRGGGAGSGRCV